MTQNKHDQDHVRLVGRKPTTFHGGYPEDLSQWPEDLMWQSSLFFSKFISYFLSVQHNPTRISLGIYVFKVHLEE